MKTRIYLLALLLSFSFFATTAQAADKAVTTSNSATRVMEIQDRVDAIRAMDLTDLSNSERKELRHELKGMNSELRTLDPILYISGGALILIIILLILLL